MQKGNNSVVNKCIERWKTQDQRTEHFARIYNEWIEHIPEKTCLTVNKLLEEFYYYPHEVVNVLLKELHGRLLRSSSVNFDNTIYTLIKSKTGTINSSYDYWSEYRYLNGISKHVCIGDISRIREEQWEFIENIVLIDDCSGSGKTFTNYIDFVIDLVRSKHIYLIAIHVMEEAVKKIGEYADANNLKIDVICKCTTQKAFDNPCFLSDPEIKDDFIHTSEILNIPRIDILGRFNSESICAFYNNTPNNTLGIFRYDTETLKSPFPRMNELKPVWSTGSREKKKRGMQNLHSKIERNRYD
jgi:hypothetical protein